MSRLQESITISSIRRVSAFTAMMALACYLLVTPAQAFRFVFLADSRHCNGDSINKAALKDILKKISKISEEEPGNPIDFVIFGGDMACQGGLKNLQEWKSFINEHLPTKKGKDKSVGKTPLYAAKGNHELYGLKRLTKESEQLTKEREQLQRDYLRVFPPIQEAHPYARDPAAYSFEHSQDTPCQFVVLDTYEDLEGDHDVQAYLSPNQITWIDRELGKAPFGHSAKTFGHRFVFGHCPVKPLHPENHHGWRDYPGTNRQLAQKLRKHQVRAYFCGHDHTYDRKDNLDNCKFDQIIVGNAGADSHDLYNFMVVDVVSSQEVKYICYIRYNGHWFKQSITNHYPPSNL
jgi:3',5'-cyclic AMP phosphodiesterase CpdA